MTERATPQAEPKADLREQIARAIHSASDDVLPYPTDLPIPNVGIRQQKAHKRRRDEAAGFYLRQADAVLAVLREELPKRVIVTWENVHAA